MSSPPGSTAGVVSAPPTHRLTGARARVPREPAGEFVTLHGETYYRIAAYHRLRPFLMCLASDTDLWVFVGSGGGLTAGRRDPDGALFPYETVDRLHDAHHHTGPITLLRISGPDGSSRLWEPFSPGTGDDLEIERNLYKNVIGNRLVFEEIHHGLGFAFRYRWCGSETCGLVRTATIENLGSDAARISFLDGLRNVLPFGVPLSLSQHSSSLVDAYKRVDLDAATGIGMFSLTTRITDRPEAAEVLRANTVWCHGLEGARVCLSLDAVAAFRRGEPVAHESVLTGRRGNYLVTASLELEPRGSATWHIVADVGRSHAEIASLRSRLLGGEDAGGWIEESLRAADESLLRTVASADGIQLTGHPEATAHHFANVLFNIMRGGVFLKNHEVPIADLRDFLRARNRTVAARHEVRMSSLAPQVPVWSLLGAAREWGDADLERLCHEYLPVWFGRRHGDPSRPWNRFSIRVRNPDGGRALLYEGNWRDIFQNWEALGASFPGFLPNFIAKFVNASTVDGFNPYRITREGLDWEVADPSNPWSHIGYWGDHQIVYLLRFLEALEHHEPGALADLLPRPIFSYADVPYRLKPYEEIVADPRSTIHYDTALAARIEQRVAAIGTDGKLLPGPGGSVHHASLLEKLLVPALSKLSNFVPDGGIWMNTQRPEWNDANNALAGYGVSVVTLCHLRRYLGFVERILGDFGPARVSIAGDVAAWLRRIHAILGGNATSGGPGGLDGRARKRLMDALGTAFSDYRTNVYTRGFSSTEEVPVGEVVAFCRTARDQVDRSIHGNRRPDGLYHSYHLLEFTPDGEGAVLHPLDEMLEGQVAVLGSGVVDEAEAVTVLAALFESRLYREDQRSFLLYPAKDLPGFLERNVAPEERVLAVPLLRGLLDAGERSLVERDTGGAYRFHGDLRTAGDVRAALDHLALDRRWTALVAQDRRAVLELFEAVFRHHAFTGRSGAMYAYEGIGCIYWHMVSKLLLATQEVALQAMRDGEPDRVREALITAYHRIRAGLGYEKTVTEYGAIPMDPYSHTPLHAGAQQPGMTGQAKEGILARFGELGVHVASGRVGFRPLLLRERELLRGASSFRFFDVNGRSRSLEVRDGTLAFTFCQVPVVYVATAGESWIRVTNSDGTSATRAGDRLDLPTSRALLSRDGAIDRIDVGVPEAVLRGF